MTQAITSQPAPGKLRITAVPLACALLAAITLAGCASQGPAHTPLAQLSAADVGLNGQPAPNTAGSDATVFGSSQW